MTTPTTAAFKRLQKTRKAATRAYTNWLMAYGTRRAAALHKIFLDAARVQTEAFKEFAKGEK